MKKYIFIATIGILVLTGCSSGNTGSPKADAGAQVACQNFRSTISDASSGILTPDQERSRLQDVYNYAKASSNDGIASGAQALLAAIATGDGSTFSDAADTFLNSCVALGQ